MTEGRLLHLDVQIAAFEAALARGRMHHAWLLTGPEGLGKALFAWMAGGRLLGSSGFDAGPDDPTIRLMAAGSHPDFMMLALEERDRGGGMRREITVDQARRLPEFFSKAPAIARYRVCIIDAADDLNTNAANAVLKTLEEPSGRGVILLVSHAPGSLLPTIRSRCRRLAFRPWPTADLARWLENRGIGDAEALAAMAEGSPGRALALAQADAPQIDAVVDQLLTTRGPARLPLTQGLADGFRGDAGRHRFALVLERLRDRVRARPRRSAIPAGPRPSTGWPASRTWWTG